MKHFDPLDFVFQLTQEQGIVLLLGGGFEAPQWSVRVSRTNLPEEAYLRTGQAIADLMKFTTTNGKQRIRVPIVVN